MSESLINVNAIFIQGIENRDYTLIQQSFNLGGAVYDKNKESHKLLFNLWHKIIALNDLDVIQNIYQSYPFKSGHHFSNLLISIVLNKKESFDFFLTHCKNDASHFDDKYGILINNACKVSSLITYEEDFDKHYLSDYFISQLLKQNINLEVTTSHPLITLAKNNNFHSWQLIFNHIKNTNNYDFKKYKKIIISSFYQFLNQNSFLSEPIQYFFSQIDKKILFYAGLKKVSHPSYKGNDLETFCLEMYSQEPQLFISKSKSLGKKNLHFLSTFQKVQLFNQLNEQTPLKNIIQKGIKI